MNDVAWGALVVVFLTACGRGVLRLSRADRGHGRDIVLAASFLVGAAAYSLMLLALSPVLGSFAVLGAAVCAAALAALALPRRLPPLRLPRPRAPSVASLLVTGVGCLLLGDLAAVAAGGLRSGLGWDGLAIYAMKASAIAGLGHVPAAVFSDPAMRWAHPEYPLLVPGAEALIFQVAGLREPALMPLFLAFDLALLAMLFAVGRRLLGIPFALIATCLLVVLPTFWDNATRGYADVAMAAAATGTVGLVALWIRDGHRNDLALAGILGAVGIWTKREGAIIWAICLGTVVIRSFAARRLGPAIRFAVPVLALVPWFIVLAIFRPSAADYLPVTASNVQGGLGRLPVIAGMALGSLTAPDRLGWTWMLVVLAIFIALLRRAYAPLWLSAVALAYVSLIALTFTLSVEVPWELHMSTSYDRIVFEVTPLALLAVVSVLAPPPAQRPAQPGSVSRSLSASARTSSTTIFSRRLAKRWR